MEDVLNATLAGGVIIGTTSDMMKEAWGVFLLGSLGGSISVVGYHTLAPKLKGLWHDTCGVHNLHGLPGFLGGVTGAIFAYSLPDDGIESIFGARLKGRTSMEQGNM
jgi:ammonium transporter Rh